MHAHCLPSLVAYQRSMGLSPLFSVSTSGLQQSLSPSLHLHALGGRASGRVDWWLKLPPMPVAVVLVLAHSPPQSQARRATPKGGYTAAHKITRPRFC